MTSKLHILGFALEADWVAAWGSWVGGLGTIGTVSYAIVGLRREAQRRAEDVRQLRDSERATQAAQARTVVLHDPGLDGHLYGRLDKYKITLGNYGLHPITNVVGALKHVEKQQEIGLYGGGQAPLPVLEGGKRHQLQWDISGYGFLWPDGKESYQLPELFHLEVLFTDVHGIRWSVQPGLGQQPSRVYDS